MHVLSVVRAVRAVIVPAVVVALVAFPLGVLASHSFTDVPTTHQFHADIAALKDSGVSPTGCGGGNYCPDDFVTRGQMAAFLNRLGALGPGKVPVTNATKLDGLDSTDFLRGNVLTVSHPISLSTGSSEVTWFATVIVQPAGHVLTSNVAGNVTATLPATCGGGGFGDVFVFIDGHIVAARTVSGTAGSTVTLPLLESNIGINFAAPAAAAGRNVEVKISDTCSGGSENIVFESLTLNFVLAG